MTSQAEIRKYIEIRIKGHFRWGDIAKELKTSGRYSGDTPRPQERAQQSQGDKLDAAVSKFVGSVIGAVGSNGVFVALQGMTDDQLTDGVLYFLQHREIGTSSSVYPTTTDTTNQR